MEAATVMSRGDWVPNRGYTGAWSSNQGYTRVFGSPAGATHGCLESKPGATYRCLESQTGDCASCKGVGCLAEAAKDEANVLTGMSVCDTQTLWVFPSSGRREAVDQELVFI